MFEIRILTFTDPSNEVISNHNYYIKRINGTKILKKVMGKYFA